ncbi:uncharacterized protein LOC110111168 isoform X3 [Dendrobium catenatum]|uniref:uncharacterized protein LOC110111168 isoform X3 n=1 Tax=Dendrobium catenatum TaxID=906689 RepID=UPI00109F43E1|nr:uncharacterized protein LOC110111168 isoform X3 [Dendrobium catenatum]
MASSLCSSTFLLFKPSYLSTNSRLKAPLPANCVFRSQWQKPSSSPGDGGSKSENAVLRVAWYGSELLGIAASFFRPTPLQEELSKVSDDELGILDRGRVVEAIKDDFRRSYFVTGNLTLSAYNEDCEFADPAGSFRGLRRFKRNCSNFGSLLEKSNMELMKWEECEDKGIGHWRFSCVMSFPWRPILSATGYTEYYFDIYSGKVCSKSQSPWMSKLSTC